VCNGDWQQHGNHTGGYYKCNRWDPKAKPDAAAAAAAAAGGTAASAAANAEQAKAELNRYLHYYQRFHNHDQSKRFAERQRLQTDRRMASLHAQSGGDAAWIEFEFLASATAQVLECRNVLKYTYVFAYYLPDGPEKTLFEFLQQQLEAATEHLSELSELPPLDKLDRAQIINYTRITQQFCTNLINGVQNGLTPAA
jgi:ariadne-1